MAGGTNDSETSRRREGTATSGYVLIGFGPASRTCCLSSLAVMETMSLARGRFSRFVKASAWAPLPGQQHRCGHALSRDELLRVRTGAPRAQL